MSIGDQWNPEDWDDSPLTDEELSETLAIHRRHKDGEEYAKTKRPIKDVPLRPTVRYCYVESP